jgi:Holliday junction DNA helicase RuvA
MPSMIGKLTGIIDNVSKDSFILDVSGVGYVVYASPRTLSAIGNAGDRVSVSIHTHVREDMIQLYGFSDAIEQEWFNLLTTVQGVGNKVALAILGVCQPDRLALIIASQDKAAITQADGVGPKLGLRILTELKDKAGDIALKTPVQSAKSSIPVASGTVLSEQDQDIAIDAQSQNQLIADSVSALLALGYSRSEAYSAVTKVISKDQSLNDIQKIITLGLRELAA